MSDNFLQNIKRDLANPDPRYRSWPGLETLKSRDIYQLVESYERMESAMRADHLGKNLRHPVEVEQYINEALRAAFLHTGQDITSLMCVITRTISDVIKERVDQEWIRKGKNGDIDY